MLHQTTLAIATVLLTLLAPVTVWGQVDFLFADPPPPAPRRPDGTIDFGGKGLWEFPFVEDFALALRGAADIPFMAWSEALFEYHQSNYGKYDPELFCLPSGVGPRAMSAPYPAEFINLENPARIIVLYQGGGRIWRVIHLDGRPFPEGDALNPTYQGYSVGHWEGDTLVIETRGYNERTWLDFAGHVHTGQLVTIERMRRPDLYTMEYEATILDPGAYTAPWTIGWTIRFEENPYTFEYICQENVQYLLEMLDDFGEPFFERTEAVD